MKIIHLKFEIVHNARLCTRINEFVVVFCWLLVAYCYLFLTICLIWRQHREKLYTEWRENVERVFLLFTKCHLFDLFRCLFTNYYSTFVGWFRISDLFRICCCSHALYLYLYVRLNVLDARHLVLCRCVVVSLTDNYVWIDGQHDLNIGSVVPCSGGPFFILLSYSSLSPRFSVVLLNRWTATESSKLQNCHQSNDIVRVNKQRPFACVR